MKNKSKWKKAVKPLIIIAILLVAAVVIGSVVTSKGSAGVKQEEASTAKVETRDIQYSLSSSGTVDPLNSYNVTSLVDGEIVAAEFEEGDTVKEGQVLYRIDTDTADSKEETAQTSLDRAIEKLDNAKSDYQDAKKDLQDAQEDYNTANDKYGDPNFHSTESGIVKTLLVEEGDTIQAGTQIAAIYDNSSMILTIPFPAAEVDRSTVGKSAVVTIEATNETVTGKVTEVSSIEESLTGNRLVKQVKIQVKNPGGITTATKATAVIGSLSSSEEGSFSVLTDTIIVSDVSGDIKEVKVDEGTKVKEGDVLFTLTAESVKNMLASYTTKRDNAKDALDQASDNIKTCQESVEDAQKNLEDAVDAKADYSITAPISGVVISKNSLVGDNIRSAANTALCVIYDLSSLTFKMDVDELDVNNVKIGQSVNITADAFEDQTFTGTVTNISLESISNQGVTQYPVTVRMNETGNLLPGMNVTGEIVVSEAKGVLAVPADSLMRGNLVYVKDDTVKEAVGDVPAGFRAVEVETGLTDGDYIEIKSGLTGEEEVYVEKKQSTVVNTMPGMGGGMPGQDSSGQMPGQGSNSGFGGGQ